MKGGPVLPGLVLDTTGPDHLSVRETGEMADPRTASATLSSATRNLYSACCSPAPFGRARGPRASALVTF